MGAAVKTVSATLLLLFMLGCASCRTKPPRQILCIMDAASAASYCFDTEAPDNEPLTLLFSQMNSYVCRSPDDERVLEEWAKRLIINCGAAGSSSLIKQIPIPLDKITLH